MERSCSACISMKVMLPPGVHCASTTNRNFEGAKVRSYDYLCSPAMAVLAAIKGHFMIIIKMMRRQLKTCNHLKYTGTTVALMNDGINTDQILPVVFAILKKRLWKFLFANWRYSRCRTVKGKIIQNLL